MATPRQKKNARVHAKARRRYYGVRTTNHNITRGASYTDFPRNTWEKPGTEKQEIG